MARFVLVVLASPQVWAMKVGMHVGADGSVLRETVADYKYGYAYDYQYDSNAGLGTAEEGTDASDYSANSYYSYDSDYDYHGLGADSTPASTANYTPAPKCNQDYTNPDGWCSYPWQEKWEDCICQTGKYQSPINLKAVSATVMPTDANLLWSRLSPTANMIVKEVENTCSTIEAKPCVGHDESSCDGDFGEFKLPNSETWPAAQFHFHFPSEHTVGNNSFFGEMHIVHQMQKDADCMNRYAVIGVFLKEGGKSDPLFETIGLPDHMPQLGDEPYSVNATIDLYGAIQTQLQGPFWHYVGSLTTPNCTEGVHWYVLERTLTVDAATGNKFKEIFGGNTNRPIKSRENYDETVVRNKLSIIEQEWMDPDDMKTLVDIEPSILTLRAAPKVAPDCRLEDC